MDRTAAGPNEQVTKLEWFSGACTDHSKIETNRGKTYTPLEPKWNHALTLIQRQIGNNMFRKIETFKQRGGVMWSLGNNPKLAFCGAEDNQNDAKIAIEQRKVIVQEKDSCCNTVKCPLPFAIPGSTGFQYRVQAQAIAATLTDSCYSNSKCLNQCKTRLQTGLVDPVAQARARAIAGARR